MIPLLVVPTLTRHDLLVQMLDSVDETVGRLVVIDNSGRGVELPDGRFAVGPSSATITMHWAAFLGAAHIVLVGFDCGVVDGAERTDGYVPPANEDAVAAHSHHRLWGRQMEATARLFRSHGVSVHSLNPWATLGLEGHRWEQRR